MAPRWLPVDVSYPRVVLGALVVAIGVGLVVGASISSAAFDPFNTGWDGASQLQAEADAVDADSEIVRNTSRYDRVDPEDTVALVLSPDRGYTSGEVARIEAFVRDGGTLVVADDFGPHANQLLAGLDVSARLDGRLLRDERYHDRSPAMPLARNVSNATILEGVDGLTLNYGTAVRPHGATVLVSSSAYAYADTNRNDDLDDEERLGTYPVATSEPLGDGRVVVVGDPSLFINVMLERGDNRAFVRALFARHERVLLDYSHAASLPPLRVAVLVLQDSPLAQFVLGTLVVGALGAAGWWPRIRGSRPVVRARRLARSLDPRTSPPTEAEIALDSEEMAAVVRAAHPDWDAERVERVTTAVMGRRPVSDDDE